MIKQIRSGKIGETKYLDSTYNYLYKGSLYTTTKYMRNSLSPKDHILYALEAAEKTMCGVKRPFVIINSKGEEEIIE